MQNTPLCVPYWCHRSVSSAPLCVSPDAVPCQRTEQCLLELHCLLADGCLLLPSFQDECAQGQVFLGRRDEGYEVREDLPQKVWGKKKKPVITLVTPVREFVFICENDWKQREWMDALNRVITQL